MSQSQYIKGIVYAEDCYNNGGLFVLDEAYDDLMYEDDDFAQGVKDYYNQVLIELAEADEEC